MKTFIFKNKVTGETKPPINAASFVLADEYFQLNYLNCGSNWETVELPIIPALNKN